MSFVTFIHRTRAILVVFSFFVVLGVILATTSLPENVVRMPVEVIGPDGYKTSVTVNASDVSDVTHIWLKAYSIGYPAFEDYNVDKASIRINGSSWIDVNDAVASCEFPESNLDCISGPYPTIRFEIPVSEFGQSALRSGSNVIEFRFNYAFPSNSPDAHGDKSTGYRILGIELRNSGDADRIDGTNFTWDDPGSWTAPNGYGDAQSVAEGKDLWHERNSLVDGWKGDRIRAACSDCHAQDGRDLQYFAFSNNSIIQRSRFHGLSKDEAKKIAAYVRSIELQDVDDGHTYDPPGRPWHPVYQPGPSSAASRSAGDSREVGRGIHDMPSNGSQYWAAGAGLEWALDHDRETLSHLFPNGPSKDDIDVDESLDVVSIPVALQFPDWNEWLPTHHPLDIWGDDFKNREVGPRDWNAYKAYYSRSGDVQKFKDCFDSRGDVGACMGKAEQAVHSMWEDSRHWGRRAKDSWVEGNMKNLTHHSESAFRQVNITKWGSVKAWELNHTYDMADETGNDRLLWVGKHTRNPFDNAPHIAGEYAGDKSDPWDLWLDNGWYEVNTRINHGRGVALGIRPNDWKYQHMHIRAFSQFVPQALRMVTSYAKAMGNCEYTERDSEPKAWFQRDGHCDFASVMVASKHVPRELDSYRAGLARDVYEAVFREQVEVMMYRHSNNEWSRESGESGWEPRDFKPTLVSNLHHSGRTPSNYLTAIDRMASMGVSATLLDSAAHWGEEMNPAGDWEAYFCKSNGGKLDCSAPRDRNESPSVSISSPSSNSTIRPSENLTITAEASDADGSVAKVEFFAAGTRLGAVSSAPFEYVWKNLSVGTYELTARATDDSGNTKESKPVTVTVSEPLGSAGGSTAAAYNVGGSEYVADDGTVYASDDVVSGGKTYSTSDAISGTTADEVYQTERYGDFSYALPVTGGTYELTFKFAEIYQESSGQRIFDVIVEGQEVISDLDIYAEVGKNAAFDVTHRVTVEDGELNVTFNSEKNNPKLSALTVQSVEAGQQVVELEEGWNIVSLGVEPSDPSMDAVFSEIASKVEKVESAAGDAYVPGDGTNTIGDWNPQEAYRIYANSPVSFTVEGSQISPSTAEIQLEKGWNWVPYLGSTSQPVEDAFSSISDDLAVVKSAAGDVYHPDYNVKTLKAVEPGSGYMVYVRGTSTLTYPETGSSGE